MTELQHLLVGTPLCVYDEKGDPDTPEWVGVHLHTHYGRGRAWDPKKVVLAGGLLDGRPVEYEFDRDREVHDTVPAEPKIGDVVRADIVPRARA